jgi:hypothetical protein
MRAAPCSTQKSRTARETLESAAQELGRSGEVTWAGWVRLSRLDPGVAERPLVEGVKETAGRVLGNPELRADLRTLIHGVFQCAGEALDAYQGFKRRQGLMDFVDQERQVLELARRNPGFRAAVGGRLERLAEFIRDKFPQAGRLRREWPVSLRTPEHRTLQGWIDLLVETPGGYVVVDHKSFPGTDWLRRARESAPQLRLYREGVEKATGRPVLATLIHFPVLGRVVEVGGGGG